MCAIAGITSGQLSLVSYMGKYTVSDYVSCDLASLTESMWLYWLAFLAPVKGSIFP